MLYKVNLRQRDGTPLVPQIETNLATAVGEQCNVLDECTWIVFSEANMPVSKTYKLISLYIHNYQKCSQAAYLAINIK